MLPLSQTNKHAVPVYAWYASFGVRDVMELIKIRIRRMRSLMYKFIRMRMRMLLKIKIRRYKHV